VLQSRVSGFDSRRRLQPLTRRWSTRVALRGRVESCSADEGERDTLVGRRIPECAALRGRVRGVSRTFRSVGDRGRDVTTPYTELARSRVLRTPDVPFGAIVVRPRICVSDDRYVQGGFNG
jgi:hypothetical protein